MAVVSGFGGSMGGGGGAPGATFRSISLSGSGSYAWKIFKAGLYLGTGGGMVVGAHIRVFQHLISGGSASGIPAAAFPFSPQNIPPGLPGAAGAYARGIARRRRWLEEWPPI